MLIAVQRRREYTGAGLIPFAEQLYKFIHVHERNDLSLSPSLCLSFSLLHGCDASQPENKSEIDDLMTQPGWIPVKSAVSIRDFW